MNYRHVEPIDLADDERKECEAVYDRVEGILDQVGPGIGPNYREVLMHGVGLLAPFLAITSVQVDNLKSQVDDLKVRLEAAIDSCMGIRP